jgi:hypothetical protein
VSCVYDFARELSNTEGNHQTSWNTYMTDVGHPTFLGQ